MILGEENSKFPFGNALFINDSDKKILFDTNPGIERISKFLKSQFELSLKDITHIFLSHTHLDHTRGLATIFEHSDGQIYGHSDTLERCEKRERIGLYAGIQKEDLPHFEAFGSSLGFKDRSYPSSNKNTIKDKDTVEFDDISIIAHETSAHCLHMLDYEIIEGNLSVILSCDYDFSPIPWYGVPQRGAAIRSFKSATKQLVDRNSDYIIPSHRTEPIANKKQIEMLNQYFQLIDKRTKRAINLLTNRGHVKLKDIGDFVYPVSKMRGKYSEDYCVCAQIWDYWILLAHLEEAWRLGKVKCVDNGGDEFLKRCIKENQYLPHKVQEILVKGWAEKTLHEKMPYPLPVNSIWEKKGN